MKPLEIPLKSLNVVRRPFEILVANGCAPVKRSLLIGIEQELLGMNGRGLLLWNAPNTPPRWVQAHA